MEDSLGYLPGLRVYFVYGCGIGGVLGRDLSRDVEILKGGGANFAGSEGRTPYMNIRVIRDFAPIGRTFRILSRMVGV